MNHEEHEVHEEWKKLLSFVVFVRFVVNPPGLSGATKSVCGIVLLKICLFWLFSLQPAAAQNIPAKISGSVIMGN
jgi:hypothetical protein